MRKIQNMHTLCNSTHWQLSFYFKIFLMSTSRIKHAVRKLMSHEYLNGQWMFTTYNNHALTGVVVFWIEQNKKTWCTSTSQTKINAWHRHHTKKEFTKQQHVRRELFCNMSNLYQVTHPSRLKQQRVTHNTQHWTFHGMPQGKQQPKQIDHARAIREQGAPHSIISDLSTTMSNPSNQWKETLFRLQWFVAQNLYRNVKFLQEQEE